MGPGAKAGGPHYVAALGHWEPDPGWPVPAKVPTGPALAPLLRGARAVLPAQDWERLRWAAAGDEEASRTMFAVLHDPSALAAEVNVLRYRPASAVVRVEGAEAWAVLRQRIEETKRDAKALEKLHSELWDAIKDGNEDEALIEMGAINASAAALCAAFAGMAAEAQRAVEEQT